ncbi:MAG: hypothetical protein M0D57_04235 [Sphingobacteriales bacterium JAD_PAG50586_3]|nr:MAG: hypothetical protein M0D57_04235 [Sphingobacteriales bacterium JAD_PAG50586_3]
MKRLALVAIVTMLGYVSAQAQSTRTTADDNKDGKKTYGVSTPANQPGVKKIENKNRPGAVKNKKSMVRSGTAVKSGQAKPTGAKPHPTPAFNKGKGKKNGHHKKHQNNGKHLGHYKHTTVATPSRGCNK